MVLAGTLSFANRGSGDPIHESLAFCAGLDGDRLAIADFRSRIKYHGIARFQAIEHFHPVATLLTGPDAGAHGVSADDQKTMLLDTARAGDEGGSGYREHTLPVLQVNRRTAVLARFQSAVLILQIDLCPDGPIGRVKSGSRPGDGSLVGGPVTGVNLHRRPIALVKEGRIGVRNRDNDPDLARLYQGKQGAAPATSPERT